MLVALVCLAIGALALIADHLVRYRHSRAWKGRKTRRSVAETLAKVAAAGALLIGLPLWGVVELIRWAVG